jgi:DNA helicase-2/ATP-dependent DNA helicase PcrA
MDNYLEQLNSAQKEAVIAIQGPSLVIAGAGSGKTKTLTYRIAHLINNGIPPWSILALTFTNKAAKEMKERIAQVVGNDFAKKLWMGTFHSIFARILRTEAEHLKFPTNFTIYDTADSKNLIKSILKEMNLDDKTYKPGSVLSRISAAKNNLMLPNAYMNDNQRIYADQAAKMPLTGDIYYKYMKACFKAGAMDFDDILLNTNILFRDFPDVLEKYRDHFHYILVDEYQDTNYSQYIIVKKLAAKNHNVCVVGDDAQSIYSFRGAKIENILKFAKDYPDYKLFKLEQNYRSTQNIVNAANSIIAKNKEQIRKTVFSKNGEGEKIKIVEAYSDNEEGYIVANDIYLEKNKNNLSFDDFAILYRTNAQSRIFEESLRRNNIPYKIYGGLSFYQRKEIKDVLAYFRMVINPNDGEALKRTINSTKGIGKTTLDKLEQAAAINDTTIWNILINPNLSALGFNTGTLKKLAGFVSFIEKFAAIAINNNAYDFASQIINESGIITELKTDNTPENQTRLENIEELLNAVREFTDERNETGEDASITTFLEDVSLMSDLDTDKPEDAEMVKLMTIHTAKGLEFGNVYIVGVEENLFPSYMTVDTEEDLEEERRLFYVALTRAKARAVITYAKTRFKYGEMAFAKPSRFLNEIDARYLDLSATTALTKSDCFVPRNDTQHQTKQSENRYQPKPSFKKFTLNNIQNIEPKHHEPNIDSAGEIKVGTKVSHEKFGEGTVTNIEGIYPNTKAEVSFKNVGKKLLILKFAKLKVLA